MNKKPTKKRVDGVPKTTSPRGSNERSFNVVIERDEEGWLVASVPALPGCHTQAKSLDQLQSRIREAIEAYLDAFPLRAGEAARSEFVAVQRVAV